ncbi:MAG: CPBP family intramembrane glutamic endopeptidase [Actinomycetota bacterium]|nr:CPBP family intramembrane glutamic endopeptidase [Actinomycetota bacterium]
MSDYLQEVEWSLPQVLYVFLGGIIGAFISTAGVLVWQGSELNILTFVASFAGQAGGNLIVMWILSIRSGTGNFCRDYGLTIEIGHWWGIPAGFGLQIAVVILTAPLLRMLFPEGAPQQGVAEITEGTTTVLEGTMIVLMVGVAAPVVEEILFRGMLLSRLLRSMSSIWAVVVQALVFSGIHLLDPNAIAALPGLFAIGVVLGFAALRSRNLSLPILIHAGVNLTAAVLLIFGGGIAEWLEEVSQPEIVQAFLSLVG